MTDFKCFARCVKNCDNMCKICPEHSNKDCHLKKFCCCYEVNKFNDMKESKDKNETRVCKICCCLITKCKCPSKSPQREKCTCCKKNKSPEQELCKLCCCLMKNCICKDKIQKRSNENHMPRTLFDDLPLYDEKSHLLGYIKKGAIIDEPFCVKSRDKVLENKSNSETERWPRARCAEVERPCMASCRYAEGVRKDNGDAVRSVPRWTTKSTFDHATRSPSPTQPRQTSPSKQKSKKKSCACGK